MVSISLKSGGGGMGWGLPKVIKCTSSKGFILTFLAPRRHFRYQGRSKWGQGHPRSSSAIFQKVYVWPPTHSESILDTYEGQNEVKIIEGNQVHPLRKHISDTREGQNEVKFVQDDHQVQFSKSLFLTSRDKFKTSGKLIRWSSRYERLSELVGE